MSVTDLLPEAIWAVTITAVGGIIVAVIARGGRRDELDHKRTSDLIEQQGAELKRLRSDRDADRERLEEVERKQRLADQENWRLEGTNRRLRRGARQAMHDLEDIWDWVDQGAQPPPPRRPEWSRLKQILGKPPDHKARLPPDGDDITRLAPTGPDGLVGAFSMLDLRIIVVYLIMKAARYGSGNFLAGLTTRHLEE